MSLKVKGLFKFRRSTNDLSEWNKNDEKLSVAIREHDLNKVDTILLKKGVVSTKLDQHGSTLFHKACSEGNFEVVTLFLAHKADTNAIDSEGRTSLHCAAQNGQAEIVDKLLRMNNNSYATDNYNLTALHYACISGSEVCAKTLLSYDAPINHTDKEGRTGLFMAAQLNHSAICKLLLDHGCNVNHRDGLNRTALMVAAEFGNREVCEILVRHGANSLFVDDHGHNASWYAVKGDHLEVKVVIDQAPSIATWNIAQRSSKCSSSDGSHKHADQFDEVSPFDDTRSSIDPLDNAVIPLDEYMEEEAVNITTRVKEEEATLDARIGQVLQAVTSKPKTKLPSSPEDQEEPSREPSPPGPPVYRSSSVSESEESSRAPSAADNRSSKKAVDIEAFKELEEEHEYLNEELKRVNAENRNLIAQIKNMQTQLNDGPSDQQELSANAKVQEMEKELDTVRSMLGEAQDKSHDLEEEVADLRKQLDQDSKPEAEQDGDSWDDSSDDEDTKHKTKVAGDEGKLIAVLRSQVLGLTRENDQLRGQLEVPTREESVETGVVPRDEFSSSESGADEPSTLYKQLQAAHDLQLKKLNLHIEQLKEDNYSLSTQLSDAIEQKAELAVEKDELEERFVDLTNSQCELEQQLHQLHQSVEVLKNKSQSPEEVKSLADVSEGKTQLQLELENLYSEITVLRSRSGTPVQSSTDLAAQLQAEVIRLEDQNISLKEELQELNQASLNLQVDYETAQNEKEHFKHENEKMSVSVEDVQKQVKDLEALAGFNTQLQAETEQLKEELSLLKRESKLSRKADKTGQDTLVMLNRELQQENNDLKTKNRTLSSQVREGQETLAQRLAGKSKEADVKYIDAIVKENSELKEEVSTLQDFLAQQNTGGDRKLAQDYQNLQQESDRLKEHMKQLQEEIAKLKEQNGFLQTELLEARDQIKKDAAVAADVERNLQQEKDALQTELTQLRGAGHDSGSRRRRLSGASTSSESSAVLERSFSSADEQVKEDIQELRQRFRAATGSLKRDKGSIEAENTRLKDKVKDLQTHLHAIRKSQEEQNKYHQVTVQTRNELEEENAKLQETIRELNKHTVVRGTSNNPDGKVFQDLAKYQEENEELKRGILEYSEKWRAKTEKYEKKIVELSNEKKELKKEVDNLHITVDAAARLEDEYDQVEKDNKQLKEDVADLNDQLKEVEKELERRSDVTAEEISNLRAENKKIEETLGKFQQEKKTSEKDVLDLRQENKLLLAKINTIETESQRLSPLVNDLYNVDEMVDKLKSEKLQAAQGNESDYHRKKVSELQKEVQKLKELLREAKRHREDSSSSSDSSESSHTEKQLKLQIKNLQRQMADSDMKHREVVSVYRSHLISAVQGHIDPDVQEAVSQIIKLRSTEQFC